MKQEEGRLLAEELSNGGTQRRIRVHLTPIIPPHGPVELSSDTASAQGVGLSTVDTGKLLFTVSEAAELLSLSRAHLYRLLQRGELASIWVGRSRRVSRGALEAFVSRLEEGCGH